MMWRLAARIADWYLKRLRHERFDRYVAALDTDPRVVRVVVTGRCHEFQLIDIDDLDQLPTYLGDTR